MGQPGTRISSRSGVRGDGTSVGRENLLLTDRDYAWRHCFGFHLNPSPRSTVQFSARRQRLTLDVSLSLEQECPHHGRKQNSTTHPKGPSCSGLCLIEIYFIRICKETLLLKIIWISTVGSIMVREKKKKKLHSAALTRYQVIYYSKPTGMTWEVKGKFPQEVNLRKTK